MSAHRPGTADTLARLRSLAAGLPRADVGRLLERVAAQPEDERGPLDAALRLLGAAWVLAEVQAPTASGGPRGGQLELARRS